MDEKLEEAKKTELHSWAQTLVMDFQRLAEMGMNYLALGFGDPKTGEENEVIVQRKSGRTPADKVTALQAEVDRLQQGLEGAINRLETIRETESRFMLDRDIESYKAALCPTHLSAAGECAYMHVPDKHCVKCGKVGL